MNNAHAVLFAVLLAGCGRTAPTDGVDSSDAASDASGVDDGALDAEDGPACLVTQCDGSVLYCTPPPLAGWQGPGPPYVACPVGDGCNVCFCNRQKDGGVYNGGCTARVCYCPVPDGG